VVVRAEWVIAGNGIPGASGRRGLPLDMRGKPHIAPNPCLLPRPARKTRRRPPIPKKEPT